MENKTHSVLLQYLGDPSLRLDEEIEDAAGNVELALGIMSWDERTFVREIQYFGSGNDIRKFCVYILYKYDGLCRCQVSIIE